MPDIRHTIDGELAYSIDQLLAAMAPTFRTRNSLRKALFRLGLEPDGQVDGRTPLFLAEKTVHALRNRPGRWPDDAAESALSKGEDR